MQGIETDGGAVVTAVRGLVPRLRANGEQAEERRWIPTENIKLLEQAGVFQAAVPRRFGGLDLSVAEQVAIITEVGRGCGSTGWAVNAWMSSAGIMAAYPDRTQDEVFAGGSVRVSGGFTPTGTLTPTEGGYRLTGSWRFNTGIRGADWNIVAAMLDESDGEPGKEAEECYAVVPAGELTVADDWHVSSAAGTGSSTTSLQDVFVPAHRLVDGIEVLEGTTTGRWNEGLRGRDYGLIRTSWCSRPGSTSASPRRRWSCSSSEHRAAASPIRTGPRRPSTRTCRSSWARRPTRSPRPRGLVDRITALMQDRADRGVAVSTGEKAAIRGQVGYAVQLAKEAVEIVYTLSGASVIQKSVPIQRVYRDTVGLALHGLLAPVTNLEVHGRVLLGLDPDTFFL